MNLTVAVLLPPQNDGCIGLSIPFSWCVNTTRDIEDVDWEMEYTLSEGVKYERFSSIMVEHSNGTNSRGETKCLPEGQYTFVGEMKSRHREIIPNNAWYVLSSDGRKIGYDDLLTDRVEF